MEAGRLRPLPPVLPPFPLDKIGSSCYIITVLSQWYSYDNLKPNLTNTDLRPDQTRAQRPSQESLAETRGYCPFYKEDGDRPESKPEYCSPGLP